MKAGRNRKGFGPIARSHCDRSLLSQCCALQQYNSTNHDFEIQLEKDSVLELCPEDEESRSIPDIVYNVRREGCGVWCGVVWCGVVWCGVVWCGVESSEWGHAGWEGGGWGKGRRGVGGTGGKEWNELLCGV